MLALGAIRGDAPVESPAGPAECARFAVCCPGRRPALAGVILALRVPRDGVTVRLADAAGEVLDHLYCPADASVYTLALFAEPRSGITLRIGHVTPQSAAVVLDAACLGFESDALAPERLAPQHRLSDTAAWRADPYAEPDLSDAAARLRDRVFRGLDRPATVPWLHDLRVLLEPGDEQSHCLMKWGLYEPESLCLMEQRLRPGDVVVDVGANCGLYTLVAARAVGVSGRVIALEPSPREFERLRQNVALNGFAQVRCAAAAAADREGPVTLRVAQPPFAGHNTLAAHFAYDAVALAETLSVPGVTLDALLREERRCDLIKLDIEGAELHALRGAADVLARLRPALLVEVNAAALAAAGASVDALTGWLTDRGYRLHDIDQSTGVLQPFAAAGHATKNIMALPPA